MPGFAARTATALALALLATGASAETFTYGSGVPERSSANRAGVLPLLKAITEATDGAVSFTTIRGGQLVSLPGALAST